jgi:molybdopterin converting factor small subunit
MRVVIPSQLRSYTCGESTVEVDGETLDEMTRALDAMFPGIRFRIIDEQERIRRHIRIFVNLAEVRTLAHRLAPTDEVHIVGALSGG